MAKKVKMVVMVPQEGTVAIGLACCSCFLIFFIKPFHSRDQQNCKFIETKRGFYIKKVQLTQDYFGTQTWPLFCCSVGTSKMICPHLVKSKRYINPLRIISFHSRIKMHSTKLASSQCNGLHSSIRKNHCSDNAEAMVFFGGGGS